ncbi:MAG: leucine-rich repeat domain-containing protein [Corallococcus sp.]|nr:leucine-rich repeat domain-containing protein [Corallococcus sp.]
MLKHAAKDPSCKETENIEYWYCSDCGKYFADEQGKTEISETQTVRDKTSHKDENRDCVCDDCSEQLQHVETDGVCTVCGKTIGYTEGLKFLLNQDGESYYVCGIEDKTTSEIVIPKVYQGKPVTRIGESAFEGCDVSRLSIPQSITGIGASAFKNCGYLTKIMYNAAECADLQANDYVFAGAGIKGTGITITIGADVLKIPDYLFMIDDRAGEGALHNVASIVFKQNSKCTTVGKYAFVCGKFETVNIPASITSIGEGVFVNCTNLATVTFDKDSKCKTIGFVAFYLCGSLSEIVIPSSVTALDQGVFESCAKLQRVTFAGDSMCSSIGDSAFSGCVALAEIVIPSRVETVGTNVFFGCSLTIKCEAASKPSGWNVNWNPDECAVVWGYKQETL